MCEQTELLIAMSKEWLKFCKNIEDISNIKDFYFEMDNSTSIYFPSLKLNKTEDGYSIVTMVFPEDLKSTPTCSVSIFSYELEGDVCHLTLTSTLSGFINSILQ